MADWVRRLGTTLLDKVLPGLPPATHRYEVRRDLATPMTDGVDLLGDLYLPVDPPGPTAPTVLVRTPYGRRGALSAFLFARPFAERGFPVFVQSCRGTFGSGGVFTPMVHEREDGIDTVRWVREQPWFTGTLATTGPSYLGFTQWAVAGYLQRDDPAVAPDALALHVTMSDFGEFTWDNGAFGLRTALGWTQQVSDQEKPGAVLRQVLGRRALQRGYDRLPANEADKLATGHTVHWYQDWLTHDSLSDEYWRQQSHTATVAQVTAPVSMVTGWYDIFLPWQLRDYRSLVEAGNPPQLTVGPWGHISPQLHRGVAAETMDFLRHRLMGEPSSRTHPVRIYVTGAEQWRDLPVWPPEGVADADWLLGARGHLHPPGGEEPDPAAGPSRYTYDTADPTPAVGGPSLAPGFLPVDNSEHERRADVLTFTSPILHEPVEVLGQPRATLSLRSNLERTDLFVRICDVHPDGRSMTVCDGIRRLGGRGTRDTDPRPDADGVREVEVPLWHTAHRFLPGHRVRVQVSSGAHPRYLRNTGGDEPPATARALHRAHQEIHHDAGHRSRITLPVAPA
jgi:putative CocE/NonD family hydrolase